MKERENIDGNNLEDLESDAENEEVLDEERELFDTPDLKYLRMKEKFLQNFFFKQNWGLRGSKQRVLAFDSLVRYLQETRSLVETHPSLAHEVNRDHCRLIILKQLPLPADQLDDAKLHDVA